MRSSFALVFYYTKLNKYSIHALLGALESKKILNEIPVCFLNKKETILDDLKKLVSIYSRVLLGFSFFTPQIWDIYPLIKEIKKTFKNKVFIIAGGPHPTGDPIGTLNAGADLVVRGEGEKTFTQIIFNLLEGKDLYKTKGISYKVNGKIKSNEKQSQIKLDEYQPFCIKYSKFNPIEITRGCPFACAFCQTSRLFGTKVRHRSIEKICEFVEIFKARNLTDIRFITPNAFSYGSKDGKEINLEALENLLKNIRKILGKEGRIFFGSFPSEVRPEHVNKETIELVLKYADNDNLVIGAQSGSDRILRLCNRGHSVEDVYRAVELTIKSGLKAKVDFIFGLPGETEEDIKATIKVIEDLVKMGAIIHAHTFMPLPQTPFKKVKEVSLKPEILSLIKKLLPKGLIFGNWQKQLELSKKIIEYFNK